MSANDRAPATLWYWKDHMTDPYVRAMTYDERGRYWDVLGITHQTEEPGVMTEEQVRCWAGYTEEEWPKHRAALGGAFKIQGDVWVQKRTVEDRRKQKRRFEQSQRGGRTSAARARDSLGRLEPRLDADLVGDMASGPGTPSYAFSSSMRRDPTPPLPPSSPPGSCRESGNDNGNGADRGIGLRRLGDVIAGIDSRSRGRGNRSHDALTDAFLAHLQAQYPEFDVYPMAGALREEARSGGVRDLCGLLVHRCKERREAVARAHAQAASPDRNTVEALPRGSSPRDAASPTPPNEGQPEES